MSSGTAVTVVHDTAPLAEPKRQCCSKSEIDPSQPCSRRVTWYVEKVGYKCNLHFDRYFDAHWKTTPLDSIRRLSDNEKDFSDYKSTGAGGRPRKIQPGQPGQPVAIPAE